MPNRLPRPARKPEKAGHRDARVEVGRGDAFATGRRREPPLSGAHVGPARQHRAGLADRDRLAQRRIGARRQIGAELSRPLADQHRQAMRALADGAPRIGGRHRLDRRHSGGGAGHILLLADARIPPHPRQPQRLLLIDQAPLGHSQLLLQSAQLEIVAGHLRGHAHAHVVEVRLEASAVARRPHHAERRRPKRSISQ